MAPELLTLEREGKITRQAGAPISRTVAARERHRKAAVAATPGTGSHGFRSPPVIRCWPQTTGHRPLPAPADLVPGDPARPRGKHRPADGQSKHRPAGVAARRRPSTDRGRPAGPLNLIQISASSLRNTPRGSGGVKPPGGSPEGARPPCRGSGVAGLRGDKAHVRNPPPPAVRTRANSPSERGPPRGCGRSGPPEKRPARAATPLTSLEIRLTKNSDAIYINGLSKVARVKYPPSPMPADPPPLTLPPLPPIFRRHAAARPGRRLE